MHKYLKHCFTKWTNKLALNLCEFNARGRYASTWRKYLYSKPFIINVLKQLTKLMLSFIRVTQEERAPQEKKDCKCVDHIQYDAVCWLL